MKNPIKTILELIVLVMIAISTVLGILLTGVLIIAHEYLWAVAALLSAGLPYTYLIYKIVNYEKDVN